MENLLTTVRQQAMDTKVLYLEDKKAYQLITELTGNAIAPFRSGHELARNILQQARTNGAVHIIKHLELVCYLIAVGDAAKMYVANDPESLYQFIEQHPMRLGTERTLSTLRQLTDLRAAEDAVITSSNQRKEPIRMAFQ